jgi:hypothetical protein
MYVPKQLSNLSVWALDSKCRGLFPRVSLLADEQLAQLALKGVKEETTGPHHREPLPGNNGGGLHMQPNAWHCNQRKFEGTSVLRIFMLANNERMKEWSGWIELNWNKMSWVELNWKELKGIKLNWVEVNWLELNWAALKWIEFNWIELSWIELTWVELKWVELNGVELSWIEMNLIELNWIELKWVELTWIDLN